MKRDHTLKWQRFDKMCQKLGHTPVMRHAEFVKLPFETDEQRGQPSSARSLIFTLSASGPKRDGHEIMQDGWITDAYRQNPVVLWAHTRDTLPIAKSLKEWLAPGRGGKVLKGEPDFLTAGDNPMAEQVFRLYNSGVLNAVSVGWNTVKWEAMRDADGWVTGIRFIEQELLEYSAVPVPADPDALKHSFQDGTISRDLASQFNIATLIDTEREENKDVFFMGLPEVPTDDQVKVWIDLAASKPERSAPAPIPTKPAPKAEEADDERDAIRHDTHGNCPVAAVDTTWDSAAAKKRIAAWATAEGRDASAGDGPAEVDFKKYRQGFVFRDKHRPNDMAGYKGAHHDVVDGALMTVPRGVRAVAQRIQQQSMGVPMSSYDGMREHMDQEYARMGETPPWKRADGRLYEIMHGMLRDSEHTDEERAYLESEIVSLARKVYGDARLPEAWEGPVVDHAYMNEPARACEQLLIDHVPDAETRAELVRAWVRQLDRDIFGTLEEYTEAYIKMGQIAGVNNLDELVVAVQERFAPPIAPPVEEESLDEDTITRLLSMFDKKDDEPVDKTPSSDTDQIRTRMDALLSRLSKETPVAG